jgi:hypothetical protein
MRHINVALCEPTQMACELLSDALESSCDEIKVVTTGVTSEFQNDYEVMKSQVAVISLDLKDDSFGGLKLLRRVVRERPSVNCVLLLDEDKRDIVIEAFRSGAVGVCQRDKSYSYERGRSRSRRLARQRVAYQGNDAKRVHIYVTSTDSAGRPESLLESNSQIPNDWSPDGRYMVYVDFQAGPPELAIYDLRTHSQSSFGPRAEAQISPNGKWLAFAGAGVHYQNSDIFITQFPKPSGRVQISNHGGAQPRWSADGKELFYISADKKLMAVPIDTATGKVVAGAPHMLFQTRIIAPRIVLFQYTVSPDGKRFLINSLPSVGAAPLTVLVN